MTDWLDWTLGFSLIWLSTSKVAAERFLGRGFSTRLFVLACVQRFTSSD